MKGFLLLTIALTFAISASADHITGGEMFYTYAGNSNGANIYRVTLKLFMRCNSGRQFPNPAIISVFDRSNATRIQDIRVDKNRTETISLANNNPCITDPPTVCYEVAYYDFTVSVPVNSGGYYLVSEVNYRIRGINNLGGSQVGATYTAEIPGTASGSNATVNTSAQFIGSDLVVICTNNSFNYSFGATDADGDALHYYFAGGYASSTGGNNMIPAGPPPFQPLPYNFPNYSEQQPLGARVQIDETTGLITGFGPEQGIYVVTVAVDEIRDGKVIATQRKDLQVNVTSCTIASATLQEQMLCKTTRTTTLFNLSNSPLIVSNAWMVYNPAGTLIHSATGNPLNYTFPSNGIYRVKLLVNQNQQCSDTNSTRVFVFPGLVTDFTISGVCVNKPILFTDQTTLVSGSVNSYKWDFGEQQFPPVSSQLQNPTYTYSSQGVKNVSLFVTTTEGCRDTAVKRITILDKPPLQLAFRDTVICINDRLQLQANTPGIYQWSPGSSILNPTTASPTVFPTVSTMYYADLNVDGCVNRDSVFVKVVNSVTLQPMADTVICSGDAINLHINSDGLQYLWTPANLVNDIRLQNPVATSNLTSTYNVVATIGGCTASANISVKAVPYPVVNAGADTLICYRSKAFLHGTTDGNSYKWFPLSSLTNSNTLSPIASLVSGTSYILTATDTKGCPKPSADTVVIKVLPALNAFAGRDTAVIIGQPLRLLSSEAVTYSWSPATYLSATNISNPVAIITTPMENIRYKVLVANEIGCKDSAYINVKVFATRPGVLVPSGFTPNNDGKNDVLNAIPVGLQRIEYFNIYNRWGQLVHSSRGNTIKGWDGRINGEIQATNTFIWTVKAYDYTGAAYFDKGSVTLIR